MANAIGNEVTAIDQIVPDIMDGTNFQDLQVKILEDSGARDGNAERLERLRTFAERQSVQRQEADDRIQERVALLKDEYSEYHSSWTEFQGKYADWAIKLGGMLIGLKEDVRTCGYQWGPWCDRNLVFMNRRSRQTFMQLAKIPGASRYSCLGKDRLLRLKTATKDMTGDDTIGSFLSGYEITLDSDSVLQEFKTDVDSALFVAKTEKEGLVVDRQKVKELILKGINPGSLLLRELKEFNGQGVKPDDHLDRVLRGDKVKKPVKPIDRLLTQVEKVEKSIDSLDEKEIQSAGDAIKQLEEKLARIKGSLIEEQHSDDHGQQTG